MLVVSFVVVADDGFDVVAAVDVAVDMVIGCFVF